jgi:phenylalanyl-tRNA synthetase beta chain
MLFLKSWLEEYIDLSDYTDNEISDFLSLRSGECESVETITEYFDGKVVVGIVENMRKHPEADRLNVFDVNIGNGKKVQIVSAAPNTREGLICPVALDGAKLPYMTIIPRKMRGIESQGMCCGMSELALETEFSDGLWELNGILDQTSIGKSVCEALPKFFPSQVVFEIKYLQDKLATCANHLGLAIELAKIIQKPELLNGFAKLINDPIEFTKLASEKLARLPESSKKINFVDKTKQTNFFTILELNLERDFTLLHIYQTRMFLTGKNMIGGLADLSNYLLFDIGQPSHYFSSEKTPNLEWTIKKLDAEVEFKGLGQLKNAKLLKDLTVMIDGDNRLLTIPGVSGSEDTKTDLDTKNILIEIANFPAEMVAISTSSINYRSDAAKYWASGVNPALTLIYILKLSESLPESSKLSKLLTWDKDELESHKLESYIQKLQAKTEIKLDLKYIAERLDNRGLSYWFTILEKKLGAIGNLELIEGSEYYFRPINFYNNLKTEEDVLFEVAKLVGFDNLEPEFLNFSVDSKTPSYYHKLNYLKSIFESFGFSEILTRPFLPENKLLSSFLGNERNALIALSSQRKDEPFLRDSLFSSLLNTANSNIKLGIKEPKIFELTKVYLQSEIQTSTLSHSLDETKVWECFELSGVCCCQDPYLLTSLVNQIQKKLGLKIEIKSLEEDYVKIGNGYSYNIGDIIKINLVEIKNSIKKTFDLPLNKTIWYIEMKFNPKELNFEQHSRFSDQSDFPNIERSYSLFVPKSSHWSDILKVLESKEIINAHVNITPIERLDKEVKDIINYDVVFSSYKKTLTNLEIEGWESLVLEELNERFGAELRQ